MNKQQIPRIIHQIWSGVDDPLPSYFKKLGDTWKRDYPEWKYELWDNTKMISFLIEHYPEYVNKYEEFPYNIQRWDAIRYLILYKVGGLYVDFDYESILSMENILSDKSCCFALEPPSHLSSFGRQFQFAFNNALMACIPGHPFMKRIIHQVFTQKISKETEIKEICVLSTTGPWMLVDLYQTLTKEEKEGIYLIPSKYVTPFDIMQAKRLRQGELSEELENCLQEAYAVHYFFSDWRNTDT